MSRTVTEIAADMNWSDETLADHVLDWVAQHSDYRAMCRYLEAVAAEEDDATEEVAKGFAERHEADALANNEAMTAFQQGEEE